MNKTSNLGKPLKSHGGISTLRLSIDRALQVTTPPAGHPNCFTLVKKRDPFEKPFGGILTRRLSNTYVIE